MEEFHFNSTNVSSQYSRSQALVRSSADSLEPKNKAKTVSLTTTSLHVRYSSMKANNVPFVSSTGVTGIHALWGLAYTN